MKARNLFHVLCAAVAFMGVMFAAPASLGQALQLGINVQLAVTSNGIAVPAADKEGSAIVTVTEIGGVYFGPDLVAPNELVEAIRGGVSQQMEKQLYVKADARAHYASVWNVLGAARSAGANRVTLLTSQAELPKPRVLVPPYGVDVLMNARTSGVDVEVLGSGQPRPVVKINNESVAWANLQDTLKQVIQKRTEKVVVLRAEGGLPFATVAQVIDICRSVGAEVVLLTAAI